MEDDYNLEQTVLTTFDFIGNHNFNAHIRLIICAK